MVFSLLNAQNFCLDFGGTEDYVDIGTGSTIVKTVELWVNPAATTEEYLVDLNGTAYIWINSGTVTATGFSSPTIYVNGVEATTISANEWQHIAVTTSESINASDFDIGRKESDYLEGTIDEVCIWDDVREEDEIRPNMYRELINPTGEEGLVAYYELKGNPNIALYTKLVEDDGYDYAIQGLPPLTDGVTVKLGLDAGTEGLYTFKVVDIENFHDTTSIFLEDLYEDIVVNMRKTNEYSFTINESGSITDRFLLHFNTSAVGINKPGSINNQIKVYTHHNIICVENYNPVGDIYIEVYNTLGQQLICRKLENKNRNKISLDAGRGIYIVRVFCEDQVLSAKVYLGD